MLGVYGAEPPNWLVEQTIMERFGWTEEDLYERTSVGRFRTILLQLEVEGKVHKIKEQRERAAQRVKRSFG